MFGKLSILSILGMLGVFGTIFAVLAEPPAPKREPVIAYPKLIPGAATDLGSVVLSAQDMTRWSLPDLDTPRDFFAWNQRVAGQFVEINGE